MTHTTPTLLGMMPGGLSEIWVRDRALLVVPALLELHPLPLREAIARRRALLLHGECPCGAILPAEAIDVCSQGNDITVWHEPDCTCRDTERLMAEWVHNRSQT